jgi:tight adherence protein C
MDFAHLLTQLWHGLLSTSWLLKGVANALVLLVFGRLFLFGWREHAYLYQLDDRERAFDTWIQALLPVVRRLGLPKYRRHVAQCLARAGNRRGWDTDHFLASQVLYGGVAALATWILCVMLLDWSVVTVVLAGGMALILPYFKLSDLASVRFRSVNRDLPYFIDYLTLAMGAGLDFNQALARVIEDAPASPLGEEFAGALRNIRLGMSRSEALMEMERRLESPSLKLFVQTMVQAMALGSDVAVTLRVMAETLQQKRFQAAEELAGKISVRMMLPLMGFVLPAVMIILLGPMLVGSPLFQ